MKRIFIASIATIFALSIFAVERTASITIDDRIKHQHVTGFGGFSPSPQWSYWLNDKQMDMLNDPEACKHLDIVAGHFYGWDGRSMPAPSAPGVYIRNGEKVAIGAKY